MYYYIIKWFLEIVTDIKYFRYLFNPLKGKLIGYNLYIITH